MKRVFLALLLFFGFFKGSSSQDLLQTIEVDLRRGRICFEEALIYKVLSIFDRAKLPARYRDLPPGPLKCAAPIVWDVKRDWHRLSVGTRLILNEYLQRPTFLPEAVISPRGKFKIHYTTRGPHSVPPEDVDSDGIPDFVEEAGLIFDHCWEIEIDSLGYKPPPPDGIDGDQVDVYMMNISYYGLTYPENPVPGTPYEDYTSYIVINNDFQGSDFYTQGLDALKVTAAHEFFHAIQLGYNVRWDEDLYFFEISSTWMEDVVYDEVNDYYQYLDGFFNHPEVSFTAYSTTNSLIWTHNLGACLWNHLLTKKYGIDIIREIWEEILNYPALQAMDEVLKERGSSFSDEFVEFSIWNYFTGSRADSVNCYEEGGDYPEIKLEDDFAIDSDTTVSGSTVFLTSRYYRVRTRVSDDFGIEMEFDKPYIWSVGVIIADSTTGDVGVRVLHPGGNGNIGFVRALSEITLIPVNLEIPEDPSIPYYLAEEHDYKLNIRRGHVELLTADALFPSYPNPFVIGSHECVYIPFRLSEISPVELNILTSSGRLIRHIRMGQRPDGYQIYRWDGRDEEGEPVPSGIYIYQLKTPRFMKSRKMAVIRR